jgi:mRNA-degrading endonuclease RelE of RelBE toxin-antitoxin system
MRAAVDDSTVTEFEEDLEKLKKKYVHLKKDLNTVLKVLTKEPNNPNRSFKISNLKSPTRFPIFKLKKFKSADFSNAGSRSGFRLIYAYDKNENIITLIEIYHKKRQKNENKDRILKYFAI